MDFSSIFTGLADSPDSFVLARSAFAPEMLPGLIDLELQLRVGAFLTETLFAVKDGVKIPGDALSLDGRVVDLALTQRALSGGVSLVFLGLQNRFNQLRRLALETKRFAGGAVHINAYLTPRGARALPSHEDPYSVFVFQVAGVKRWELGDAPSSPAVLSSGDILFMRKGTRHGAYTGESASLHYTVAMVETPVVYPGDDRSLVEVLGLD